MLTKTQTVTSSSGKNTLLHLAGEHIYTTTNIPATLDYTDHQAVLHGCNTNYRVVNGPYWKLTLPDIEHLVLMKCETEVVPN